MSFQHRRACTFHCCDPPAQLAVTPLQALSIILVIAHFSAAVDTATDPKAPRIAKTAEPEDIQKATGLAYLHSSHCLGSGDIMVSAMGTPEGKGVGNFILFDQDLKVGSFHLSIILLEHVLLFLSSVLARTLRHHLHLVEAAAFGIYLQLCSTATWRHMSD